MKHVSWLFLIAFGFAACAAPQAADRTTGDGQPKYGGVINMRYESDPYDFDLSYAGKAAGTGDLMRTVTESLMGFKAGGDVAYMDKVFRPELAERWEVSPDARSYTFYLRKGARFHNIEPVNGRELTAADVKWSFEYYSRTGEFKEKKLPTAQFEWMFEGMERIETPDPYTVIIRFKEPFAPFLTYAASDYTAIVPKEIYAADGHFKDRIIGTGAFFLNVSASQKGTRWVTTKNPNYWMPDRPYLDEARALILTDDSAAVAAFQTKRLDWLGPELPVKMGQETLRGAPDAVAFKYPKAEPIHIYMNHKQPPLDDVRVRQAISLATDPDEFIKVMSDGEGGWALAGTLAGMLSDQEVKEIVRYDPEQAKRLLQQAGYGSGLTIPFEYPPDRGQERIIWFELFAAQMKRVGITLQPVVMPYAEYSTYRKAGKHHLNITSKDVVADVDSYIYGVFYPNNRNNYDGVNDPDLTKLLEAQRREADPEKRMQLIKQAVRMINGEPKWLGRALYFGMNYELWHPYVKGFGLNYHEEGWDVLVHTWLDK